MLIPTAWPENILGAEPQPEVASAPDAAFDFSTPDKDVDMDPELFEVAEASLPPEELVEEELIEESVLFASYDAETVSRVETVPALPEEIPAEEAIADFEPNLEGELAKLRQAIAALDRAFRSPPPAAEPSFADLVSDTALRRAG